MLKVPGKYQRSGIKIKCLKCKYDIGSGICHNTNKGISTCPYKELHRYNLVVCIPHSVGGRRTKILQTTDFDTALVEMTKFRQELTNNNYHRKVKTSMPNTTFLSYATDYLNAISGVNTPEFLRRQRSKEHISDSRLAITRFCLCLKKKGYNMDTLELAEIKDDEVGIFHSYLKDKLCLGPRSYNKAMGILKTLFNYFIRVKDYNGCNPFNHLELRNEPKGDPTIVTKKEFEDLLSVITAKNGVTVGQGKMRNHYHEWLEASFKLALQTGLRREELFSLRWSNLKQLEKGVRVLQVMNLKVNRIATGDGNGKSIKYVPVTKGLMQVLYELGYAEKKGTDGFIIERADGLGMVYLKNALSRSFAHYIKLVTERRIKFKDLRKTYITFLTLALGPNAKLFTGHTNDQVLKSHYLSGAFIASNISDFKIF